MPSVHFTNLLIVAVVGLLGPLLLGFFPRFRLPAIVLEILLGAVIGPSGLYTPLLGLRRSLLAGIWQSTSLPFIVAATQIGLGLGVVSQANAAGLIAAGLLSVIVSPTFGVLLLRRYEPQAAGRRELPRPMMPVISTEAP